MTEKGLRDEICKRVEEFGSYRALSRALKVSPSHIADLVHGRRRAGKKVLKAMGLKRITTVQTDIIEDGG